MKRLTHALLALVLWVSVIPLAHAAGTLTPAGAGQLPIQIVDHHVAVVIDNGFAQTEVTQTFHNPNPVDLEALYSFPLPRSASLSEVTITTGEKVINGEVLDKEDAERIYGEEKAKGNDAGLASKNEYKTLEFRVTPVRANANTTIRFLYYQPLEIDTGVGRYLYPLQEGETDEAALSFWTTNDKVENTFSVDLELKSAWPVADVRVPGMEADTVTDKLDEGHYKIRVERQAAQLNRDFIFYYRLIDNLPGRVDLVAYRAAEDKPGTFMMVLTPGLDLQPITGGADYAFVLDVSGSMQTKIHTLVSGVTQSLGQMNSDDRFRLVTFNDSARELTSGWTAATPENVAKAVETLSAIRVNNSTNLYAGLQLGLERLDADRATSLIIVTDGVTNTGVVDPREFAKLLQQYDIRLFGFVMGNSGNWPLMDTICAATGGFATGVSNDDDIIGQILLAKSKVTVECLHHAVLTFKGSHVFDTTDQAIGKVYNGQQLVIFGRYDKPGPTEVSLDAKLTGEDKVYRTTVDLPALDTDNPELERLWALDQIEMIDTLKRLGPLEEGEAKDVIRDLGLEYQIVTDYTSMVVLSDETFAERGIERNNQERVALENDAKVRRAAQPIANRRADNAQPMFNNHPAPAPYRGGGGGGGGGGALDPISCLLAAGLAGLGIAAARGKNPKKAR